MCSILKNKLLSNWFLFSKECTSGKSMPMCTLIDKRRLYLIRFCSLGYLSSSLSEVFSVSKHIPRFECRSKEWSPCLINDHEEWYPSTTANSDSRINAMNAEMSLIYFSANWSAFISFFSSVRFISLYRACSKLLDKWKRPLIPHLRWGNRRSRSVA